MCRWSVHSSYACDDDTGDANPSGMDLQLFRFVNITFTTSALAIGIRIRLTEKKHNIMGALGASA